MENTIENAKEWVKENESNYPNVFKSNHWLAQILFDYAKQVILPVVMNCSTCKHIEVSKYVEPCYGCRDNGRYDHYASAIVP